MMTRMSAEKRSNKNIRSLNLGKLRKICQEKKSKGAVDTHALQYHHDRNRNKCSKKNFYLLRTDFVSF
jgi:hypothetical protein